MKPYKLISTIAIMVYLFCGISIASADNLVWQTSKNTAVSIAKSEGKYILLLAGREACGNCQYMRYTACESASPPIKDLIEHSFVPWFCHVDNSTEWHVYASGLGSFYLPLICVIDPNDQDNYLDRTTGTQNLQTFYDRLLQYPALDSDGDGIPDSLEETGCTNSIDADSDDDGIPDGVEDADKDGNVDENETDPCDSDTDDDGIQDGTESGYTLTDIGPDTDQSFFQPDEDPDSTTDPTDEDTDDDGFLDGEEDLDHDGAFEVGETDPNNPESNGNNQSRTTVAGTVTYNGTPVTAMVLANGKYMFTGGGEGRFDLTDVPYDANEEITFYAFCSGLAPYKTILTEGAYNLEIEMLKDQGGKQLIVTIDGISESPVKPGWYDISGTIENESGTALIAMVLANGQYMFTNNPVGEFHLTVPLDSNDKITFYGFCSGFSPYKIIGGIDVLSQL